MTVAELIEELQNLPQEAIVLDYGGDERYHVAEGVQLSEENMDMKHTDIKGPFVTLF